MKEKYQKPIVRNLGDVLPTAHGVCKTGEAAGTKATGSSSCLPNGSLALGACNPGQFAQGACSTGDAADPDCNVGQTIG